MLSVSKYFTLILLVLSSTSVNAFVNKASVPQLLHTSPSFTFAQSASALSERRWNFNDGQEPWGLKKNAETWNGRVAQMAFVWVFIQELVTGKGVFKGIDEGDIFFLGNLGLFGIAVVGLTGWLAIQGEDDFTKES